MTPVLVKPRQKYLTRQTRKTPRWNTGRHYPSSWGRRAYRIYKMVRRRNFHRLQVGQRGRYDIGKLVREYLTTCHKRGRSPDWERVEQMYETRMTAVPYRHR